MLRNVTSSVFDDPDAAAAAPGAPSRATSGAAAAFSGLTLEDIARASGAALVEVEGVDAAPALRRRLLECGFTTGSPVRFLMATPFGDPLVFSLRGASIALRKSEARCVRVRPRTAS